MKLSYQQREQLLQQLQSLYNDQLLIPYIDSQTQTRIKNVFNNYQKSISSIEKAESQFNKQIVCNDFSDRQDNFRKKTHKTQFQQLNQLCDEKFPFLFNQQNTDSILKQINLRQKQNLIHQIPKEKELKQKNHKHTKQNNINLKKNISTISSNNLRKKWSQQKLIRYKIQTQNQKHKNIKNTIKKFNSKYQQKTCTSQLNALTHKNKSNGKSQKKLNSQIKRSKSHYNNLKLFTQSLFQTNHNTKSKYHTTSKNSLLQSINPTKSASKKSLLSTSKKQLKSLSQFQLSSTSKLNKKHNNLNEYQNNNFNKSIQLNKSKQRVQSKQKSNRFLTQLKNSFKKNKQKDNFQISRIQIMNSMNQEEVFEEIRINQNSYYKNQNTKKKIRLLTQPIECKRIDSIDNNQQHIISQLQAQYQNNRILKKSQYPHQQSQIQPQFQFQSTYYLQQIINQINTQQQQKRTEKTLLKQQFQQLKQQFTLQKKLLHQQNITNQKISIELYQAKKLLLIQSERKENLYKQRKDIQHKIKKLKLKYQQNKTNYQQIIVKEIPEEEGLIEEFNEVINQLKKQIKEQKKHKNQIKFNLELLQKRLQSRQIKLQSTYSTSMKIKDNLTGAFKEWMDL